MYQAIPRLFRQPYKKNGSAIATQEEFIANFDIFTEGQLLQLDWNNVFVAGGSVLACLLPGICYPPLYFKNSLQQLQTLILRSTSTALRTRALTLICSYMG